MLVRHGDIYPCYVLLVIFNPLFHGILPLFLPMLAIRIFSLVSSDNTLPNSFARRLALASDVCGGNFNPLFHGGFCFGLPSNELLILAECSGDCLRPNIDCRIFSKVSGLCLYPDTPSPPSVILRSIPVPRSIRPYHLINRRSMAQAPISVKLDSTTIIRFRSVGTLT